MKIKFELDRTERDIYLVIKNIYKQLDNNEVFGCGDIEGCPECCPFQVYTTSHDCVISNMMDMFIYQFSNSFIIKIFIMKKKIFLQYA